MAPANLKKLLDTIMYPLTGAAGYDALLDLVGEAHLVSRCAAL